MFGGNVKGGAGHIAQCAGHCACSIEACCGGFGKKAKRAEDGFELASCGSAEHGEAGEGLGDSVVDGWDESCGIWNPSAAFGGLERKSRIKEGSMPCREDLGKVFLWAAENDVINISEEMDNGLDVRGKGSKGLSDTFAHGKTKRGSGKAFALEDTVSDGKGVPDAMSHVYVKVGWGTLPHLC
jgi:hypothetical protein